MALDNIISDIFFNMSFQRSLGNTPTNSQLSKYAGDFASVLKESSIGDEKYTAAWLREDFKGRV